MTDAQLFWSCVGGAALALAFLVLFIIRWSDRNRD